MGVYWSLDGVWEKLAMVWAQAGSSTIGNRGHMHGRKEDSTKRKWNKSQSHRRVLRHIIDRAVVVALGGRR